MNNSKVIYLASRYRADTEEQFEKQFELTKAFTREIALDGHIPMTPHLYLPLCLDDDIEEERAIGIKLAIGMMDRCDILYVHTGAGISEGMKAEIEAATQKEMLIRPFQDIGELHYFLKLDAGQENKK